MSETTLPDSGARTQFETGAVRDAMKGKGLPSCIPPIALISLAKRFEDGAQKYSRGNFAKGIPLSRYYDAIFRHNYQWLSGCTKEDHLGAIMWNAAAALWTLEAIKRGVLPASLDDRFFDKDGVHQLYPTDEELERAAAGAPPSIPATTPYYVDPKRLDLSPRRDPNPTLHGDEPGVREAIQAARKTIPTPVLDDTKFGQYEVFVPKDVSEITPDVQVTASFNQPGCGFVDSGWLDFTQSNRDISDYRFRRPVKKPVIDDTDGGKYEVMKVGDECTPGYQFRQDGHTEWADGALVGKFLNEEDFAECGKKWHFRRPVKKPDPAGELASLQAQSLGATPAPKPIYPALPDDVYQDVHTWTCWRRLKAGETLQIGDEIRRSGTNWREVYPNERTIILELDIANGFHYRRKWDPVTREDARPCTAPTSLVNPFGDTPANPSPLTPAAK